MAKLYFYYSAMNAGKTPINNIFAANDFSALPPTSPSDIPIFPLLLSYPGRTIDQLPLFKMLQKHFVGCQYSDCKKLS